MKDFYNFLLKLTLLSLLIGFYSTAGFAATYYVSNTGNDANSGQSTSAPWQTLTKVNSVTFMPGDQVLFQRGGIFYGTLKNISSGINGSPITYSAYGSGEKPIITGFKTITGWVNEGGGVYSATITSESQTNMVTVDGVNTAMGRYPNSSYLTYESCNGNYSITDNGLGTTTNWTGAEAVIRKNDWTLDRCIITSHSGDVLTYTNKGSSQNATPNFGYFIQNNLRTLDSFGEWYHNTATGKFYMYFGSIDPTSKLVKVATLKNVVYNNQYEGAYITFDNLAITGAIEYGINLPEWYTQFNKIQNCNISFIGLAAVCSQAYNTTVNSNTISDCGNMGVYINRDNPIVSNNYMVNIGVVEGQSLVGNNNAIHLGNSNSSVIEYNRLENIGYDGIIVSHGTNVKIKNNFIYNVCLILNDGGGIYTDAASTNFLIDGNIIINSIGNIKGRNGNSFMAEGIYLDEYTSGLVVKNNTIVNCSNSGIKLHKASNNIIRNNTIFNNTKAIDFFNSLSNGSMSGNYMASNLFIAKSSTQLALNFVTLAQDGCRFGTADSNYYARPIKDDISIFTYEPNVATYDRTLASWQSYTGQDVHSKKSSQAITSESDFQFEYNDTKSPKTVTLSNAMIDIKGNKYSGSITLQPFTSIVLMKDKSVSSVLPIAYNVTGGGSYTSGGSGVPIGLSGSQAGVNYQLKLNGVNDGIALAGSGSALNFGNKTVAGVYTVIATYVSTGSTAIMNGSATITVNPISIVVTGVSVSQASATIYTGATQQLTATVSPTNATNKTVAWSSSNTSVATVNSNGLVTGIAAGNATIIATTQDGGKTATSSITVINSSILVTGVSVSPTLATISTGATQQLTATVTPSNATNKTVIWSSSNTSVATVNSNGFVTGVAAGNATITATTQDGAKAATSSITVNSIANVGYLGYNVIGSTLHSIAAKDINASQFTAGSSFTATSMYVAVAPFIGKIKGAIYSDYNGKPWKKLGETLELTNPTTGGFQKLGGLNVPIKQGTKYWLAVWCNVSYSIYSENSGGIVKWNSYGTYGVWPNNLTLNGPVNLKYSIYVDGGLKAASIDEGITGIDDLTGMVKIDVFPNPSVGKVSVRFSSTPEAGSQIDILDITGRKVTTRMITGNTEEFDLDNQPGGLYLIKIKAGVSESIHKLILKK